MQRDDKPDANDRWGHDERTGRTGTEWQERRGGGLHHDIDPAGPSRRSLDDAPPTRPVFRRPIAAR